MKEINWNGGFYREGGTFIYNGQVKTIEKLETDVTQCGSSVFDSKPLLRVTTNDGNVIELLSR